MITLTEFLLARVAEDEAAARSIFRGPDWVIDWAHLDEQVGEHSDTVLIGGGKTLAYFDELGQEAAAHIAKWDPAHVLAECEAKRRIVEDHAPTDETHFMPEGAGTAYARPSVPACRQCTTSRDGLRVTSAWDVADRVVAPCDTLRALAMPYADHPDYREEWRP